MTPAYPPPANASVAWFTLNLDLPADQRWTALVTPKAAQIANMIKVITNLIPDKILKPLLLKCATDAKAEFLDRFPEDYGKELSGIASATKIPICDLIIYNLAYEVLGGCTSIVAQDAQGGIHHARNLDFGLGPFNASEMQWQLTDALRPLIYNIKYTKGGQEVWSGVHYAGYIGTLTAVKKGAFSLTVDSRFDDTYEHFLVEWLKNKSDTANFLSFLTRQTFETQNSYADALEYLRHKNMVGPSYIILGGKAAGEGSVITNTPNTTSALDVWSIPQGMPKSAPFYVLETNYDHWKNPPFFDDRRDPAEDCLNKLGTAKISKESLYNVLHAHPNRNRLTTYTTLLEVAAGTLETSIQYCTEPGCVPW
jgi:acid ceramidase